MFAKMVTTICVVRNVKISRGNVILRYGDGNNIHETGNEQGVVDIVVKTHGNMNEHYNEGRDVYGASNEHVHGQQRCDKS
jgi:hypothetical protein